MSTEGRLGDLDEFAFIDRLVQRLGATRADTVVGAGEDDAAVLDLGGGRYQLATLDALVEDVHFVRRRLAAETLGRRLAAVNLSDIASMGGRPTHGLAGLVSPPDLPAGYALGVADGLARELQRWGADLVGGNVARGPALVLDLALLGEVDEAHLLLRSGARPGDLVLVTGTLGGAAAGRALLAAEADGESIALEAATREAVLARLDLPEPRLEAGSVLGPAGATAAIDTSDGLAADLGHLCRASRLGVRLDAAAVPIDPGAAAVATALGEDPLAWALAGGEDYELIVAAPPAAVERIVDAIGARTGLGVTVVAELRDGDGRSIALPDGTEAPLRGGWSHF